MYDNDNTIIGMVTHFFMCVQYTLASVSIGL